MTRHTNVTPLPVGCKRDVGGYSGQRCMRKAWKDGWCKQHHPETQALRDQKNREKWEAEYKAKEVRWERSKKVQDATAALCRAACAFVDDIAASSVLRSAVANYRAAISESLTPSVLP